MDPIMEVVALLLGFLGWVMAGIGITNRFWKRSSINGNVITASSIYENLWMSCSSDATGVHNCREFPSILSLNGYVQASRALMIVSVIFGMIGLVATLIGMQCSKAAGDNYVLKGRIAGVGGVFFLLQGLCTMISVSWYAFNITQDFFDPFFPGARFEIGEGLYIGWCSAVLAIAGGACLTCSFKMDTEEKHSYQPRGTIYSGPAPAGSYGVNAYV